MLVSLVGAAESRFEAFVSESKRPQHLLYFFPLPHGHGSFLPGFSMLTIIDWTVVGIQESVRVARGASFPYTPENPMKARFSYLARTLLEPTLVFTIPSRVISGLTLG